MWFELKMWIEKKWCEYFIGVYCEKYKWSFWIGKFIICLVGCCMNKYVFV